MNHAIHSGKNKIPDELTPRLHRRVGNQLPHGALESERCSLDEIKNRVRPGPVLQHRSHPSGVRLRGELGDQEDVLHDAVPDDVFRSGFAGDLPALHHGHYAAAINHRLQSSED